ncbi:hypothetical protein IE53DRAFT_387139 [Violaceomyces palustris]|uniref:Uncharacterized protein n=1 Tax=Violaceomyces palustris TaxID=1673888 RepID=A0ACD0NXQ9_9BASI|nr:hypothetical protein IE53DRAFT_387139 [Violaceomyces palustris]
MIRRLISISLGGWMAVGLAEAQKPFTYGTPNPNMIGVRSRGRNGATNPSRPELGTPINQSSDSRLASVNSVDDWCTFGPDIPGTAIGDGEESTVAYCTKPRNNARVIPDGTVTAAHFVKTPLYVQIMALGDFTKIGIPAGDEGGELDPHGATNMGNPIGGNVTSNVSGQDVFYEEWMNYAAANEICFRICIAGTDIAPTPLECQHTLDVMGCTFVMPGNYNDNVFESCDGDAAYPPGLYPQSDGGTSTFQQYFTGEYTANGQVYSYTNGASDQITPTGAFSTPSTSNCVTVSTISNGIANLVSGGSSGSNPSTTSTSSESGSSSSSSSSSASSSSSSTTTTTTSTASSTTSTPTTQATTTQSSVSTSPAGAVSTSTTTLSTGSSLGSNDAFLNFHLPLMAVLVPLSAILVSAIVL